MSVAGDGQRCVLAACSLLIFSVLLLFSQFDINVFLKIQSDKIMVYLIQFKYLFVLILLI